MPRANRHHLPGHIWHITHRCHQQTFLLKFVKDKKRFIYWLYEKYVKTVQTCLGIRARGKSVVSDHIPDNDSFRLKETQTSYGDVSLPKNVVIAAKNGYSWNDYPV